MKAITFIGRTAGNEVNLEVGSFLEDPTVYGFTIADAGSLIAGPGAKLIEGYRSVIIPKKMQRGPYVMTFIKR